MTHEEHRHHQDLQGVDYERRDVDIKTTGLVGVIIVLVISVFLLFINEYFMSVKEDTLMQMSYAPENPKLRDLHAQETLTLTTYKIIDTSKGVYQIPIARAMELMVNETYSTAKK
jgi:hypothetical protein